MNTYDEGDYTYLLFIVLSC